MKRKYIYYLLILISLPIIFYLSESSLKDRFSFISTYLSKIISSNSEKEGINIKIYEDSYITINGYEDIKDTLIEDCSKLGISTYVNYVVFITDKQTNKKYIIQNLCGSELFSHFVHKNNQMIYTMIESGAGDAVLWKIAIFNISKKEFKVKSFDAENNEKFKSKLSTNNKILFDEKIKNNNCWPIIKNVRESSKSDYVILADYTCLNSPDLKALLGIDASGEWGVINFQSLIN